MKTKEEIEQLAKQVISGNDIPAIDMRIGFKLGYTQCQEDMVEKYTEQDMIKFAFDTYYQEDMAKKYTEEDLKLAFETGRNFQLTGENNFNELLNSLNKQDK